MLQIYHCVKLNAVLLSLRDVETSSTFLSQTVRRPFPPSTKTAAFYYQRSSNGTVVRRRRIDNIWLVAALTARSEARYWRRIAISAYPSCIRRPCYGGSRRNIAMPLGTEKLEWRRYPVVKNFEDMFIRFDRMSERDRHKDRRTNTAWRHAARQKVSFWKLSENVRVRSVADVGGYSAFHADGPACENARSPVLSRWNR